MHPLDTNQPAHRVVRTFAFVDLCGFTDFVDAHGDEQGVGELRLLRSIVRDVAPLCGVRVDKWLGDGVMLVGVEAATAVTAVLAISERVSGASRLPLRAGIACGEVLSLEGDDYAGRTVNLAARLCDQAEPGQILAAVDGLQLPDGVKATALPDMQVRGVRQPIRVAGLRMAEPDELATSPPSVLRPAATLVNLVDHLLRPGRSA